ncbi:MAG: biotin/lipoyl-binding protein [Bacteroidales bacterium]
MKKYKFTIGGNKYNVEVFSIEDQTAVLEVNGTRYEVEIELEKQVSKTPVLVRPDLPPPSRSETKIRKSIGATQIKAPLPGNIMKVFVQQGDEVKQGDKILVYEAMKMENDIIAERGGKITAVKVKPGDSVLEGDVLVEMV